MLFNTTYNAGFSMPVLRKAMLVVLRSMCEFAWFCALALLLGSIAMRTSTLDVIFKDSCRKRCCAFVTRSAR